MIRKTFECTVRDVSQGGDGRTRATIVVSSSAQDRDGEFVVPAGGTTLKGIQFLYGHNWGDLRANIGVIERGYASGDEYLNDVVVDDNIPEHTDAIIAAGKLRNGSLNTYSIGFEPYEVRKPDGRILVIGRGDWISSEQGQSMTKWGQLELSAVPVPSNTGTSPLSVRGLEGPEGKALRKTLRAALEEILGSDEFRARFAALAAKTIDDEPPADKPAEPPVVEEPVDPDDLAAALTRAPVAVVMAAPNPRAILRSLAAVGGAEAEGDLESWFTTAEPATAGVTGA